MLWEVIDVYVGIIPALFSVPEDTSGAEGYDGPCWPDPTKPSGLTRRPARKDNHEI